MNFQVKFETLNPSDYAFALPHIEVGTNLLTRLRTELNEDVPLEEVVGTLLERYNSCSWVTIPEEIAFTCPLFEHHNRVIVKVAPYLLQPFFTLIAKKDKDGVSFIPTLDVDRLINYWAILRFPPTMEEVIISHENFLYSEPLFRIKTQNK